MHFIRTTPIHTLASVSCVPYEPEPQGCPDHDTPPGAHPSLSARAEPPAHLHGKSPSLSTEAVTSLLSQTLLVNSHPQTTELIANTVQLSQRLSLRTPEEGGAGAL